MSRGTASARWALVLALAPCALTLGCDDAAERQARAEARARTLAAAQAQATLEAAEQATSRRLEQEKQAEAERQAAAEADTRGALAACCRALAQRGFEQRSMKDMEAKRLCLEGEGRGDPLLTLRPALTQALEDRELPPACVGN